MPLAGWSTKREIIFNAVATAAAGVQLDVLLSADNFAAGFAAALSDGADLRVTASDQTTLLPFHLQFFDKATSIALLTVLTPLGLSPTSVWVWAGNAEATSVSSVDATYHKASQGNGVLAAYDFDEASGTAVVDKVGSSDFTLVGSPTRVAASTLPIGRAISGDDPVFTAGNGAATFNGSSQYAFADGILNTPPANGGLAFTFKCLEPIAGANGKRVMTKWGSTSPFDGLDLSLNAGRLVVRKTIAGSLTQLQSGPLTGPSGTNFIQGRFYVICVTWGSRGMEIWVGDLLTISNAVTTAWVGGSVAPLTLGAYNENGTPSNYLNCTIGGLTVYDHQPTEAEIIAGMRRRSVVAESATQLDKLTQDPVGALISPTQVKQESSVYEPTVIPPGNGLTQHYMFYTGGSGGVQFATTWLALSDDGVTWTHPYADPIIGGGFSGMAGHACRNSVTWDGSQFVVFVSDGVGGNTNLRRLTSPTALSGTWTLDPNIVIADDAETWMNGVANTDPLQLDDGSWLMTFEYSNSGPGPQWASAQATGPSLTGAFTIDPDSRVGFSGTQIGDGMYSVAAIVKVGSLYYGWGHRSTTQAASLPTECYVFVAGDPKGPWCKRYGAFPFRRIDAKAVAVLGVDCDQTADVDKPVVFGGKVIFHWDVDDNSGTYEARILRATYAGTLAEFVADGPGFELGATQGTPSANRVWRAGPKSTVWRSGKKTTVWRAM